MRYYCYVAYVHMIYVLFFIPIPQTTMLLRVVASMEYYLFSRLYIYLNH